MKLPRFVSLWDMLRLHAALFFQVAQSIEATKQEAMLRRDFAKEFEFTEGPGVTPFSTIFLQRLAEIRARCVEHRLEGTAALAAHNAEMWGGKLEKLTAPEVYVVLDNLSFTFVQELDKEWFLHVVRERQDYCDKPHLFGENVSAVFPEAAADICDAGNALACELPTAAVFHLMRVGEFGLRALARKAKVRIKKTPLDWAEWRTLIDQIRAKKVEPLKKRHRGPSKDANLEFYQGVLGEFEAFKDAYRNHVMHSRIRYDDPKALSAMNHVREFMQRLAARMS